MCYHATKPLPPEPHSAPAAREFLRRCYSDWGLTAMVEDSELALSELVTNAVLHASSDPTLEVRISPTTVRVEVHDDDPTVPELRAPSLDAAGGRGLHLVAEIAARWGTEPTPRGKVVWFELAR